MALVGLICDNDPPEEEPTTNTPVETMRDGDADRHATRHAVLTEAQAVQDRAWRVRAEASRVIAGLSHKRD